MFRTRRWIGVCAALALSACGPRDRDATPPRQRDRGRPGGDGGRVEQPVSRFVHVSGTLAAQEHAEVAAEIVGRVDCDTN